MEEVTQQEIVDATGLNVSTVRMWRLKGIIPPGVVGLNPTKGRGRARIFPKWVLGQCEVLVRLRRIGFTLKQAVAMWDEEERKQKEELDAKLELVRKLKLEQLLKKEKIKLNGETISPIDFCQSAITAYIESFVPDVKIRSRIFRQLKKHDLVNHAWIMLVSGFSPCLMWDGTTVKITPDFMVARHLSDNFSMPVPYVVATLYPVFEMLLKLMGREMLELPTAKPAPKVRVTYGEDTVEFDIRLGGSIGFEVDRESGRRVTEKNSHN
jgi:DNA-binding transcriptional MerR regulator